MSSNDSNLTAGTAIFKEVCPKPFFLSTLQVAILQVSTSLLIRTYPLARYCLAEIRRISFLCYCLVNKLFALWRRRAPGNLPCSLSCVLTRLGIGSILPFPGGADLAIQLFRNSVRGPGTGSQHSCSALSSVYAHTTLLIGVTESVRSLSLDTPSSGSCSSNDNSTLLLFRIQGALMALT
ncbi:hypothetical protein BDZ89DRAFT_186264 [Hymenopellis radicata]|nr:hypothetical protein BDZ89DRAFT_186264 [Hymenopellis radicata]